MVAIRQFFFSAMAPAIADKKLKKNSTIVHPKLSGNFYNLLLVFVPLQNLYRYAAPFTNAGIDSCFALALRC